MKSLPWIAPTTRVRSNGPMAFSIFTTAIQKTANGNSMSIISESLRRPVR